MKDLKWGETPLDKMTPEEVLLAAKRMYSALTSAKSVLSIMSDGGKSSFWGKQGSGGIALAKVQQAVEAVDKGYDSEDIYGAYYRYANDLLFDSSEYDIGCNWVMCDKCSILIGGGRSPEDLSRDNLSGKCCSDEDVLCQGDRTGCFQPITWDVLKTEI